jgi:hypothetical protein
MPAVPEDLWGWFGPAHERVLGDRLTPETRLVVELGSWLGMSTQFLLRRAPDATVVAIDHWLGSPEHYAKPHWRAAVPTLFPTFLVNCWPWRDRLVPMRTTTLRGMSEIADLGLAPDLVYLDASHESDDVLADLRAIYEYWPNTTVVADDWRWDSVRSAGEQFAAEQGFVVRLDDTVWTLDGTLSGFCFCTLAINEPYRAWARRLASDIERFVPHARLVVLTDVPSDFATCRNVHAVHHTPTGPLAVDYLRDPSISHGGGSAYHDKRFVIAAALELADTVAFLDADSRVRAPLAVPTFVPGVAVGYSEKETILEHLSWCGPGRLPIFVELARELGDETLLARALWCQESFFALSRDGNETEFLRIWAKAAEFVQSRGVYSGEGGVIGLAAALAGWQVDFRILERPSGAIVHDRGGPREARSVAVGPDG